MQEHGHKKSHIFTFWTKRYVSTLNVPHVPQPPCKITETTFKSEMIKFYKRFFIRKRIFHKYLFSRKLSFFKTTFPFECCNSSVSFKSRAFFSYYFLLCRFYWKFSHYWTTKTHKKLILLNNAKIILLKLNILKPHDFMLKQLNKGTTK